MNCSVDVEGVAVTFATHSVDEDVIYCLAECSQLQEWGQGFSNAWSLPGSFAARGVRARKEKKSGVMSLNERTKWKHAVSACTGEQALITLMLVAGLQCRTMGGRRPRRFAPADEVPKPATVCPTRGPPATCDPVEGFVRPSAGFTCSESILYTDKPSLF